MARSCGLRIGAKHFEVVVLDGGPKKHKVLAWTSGDLRAKPLDAKAEEADSQPALDEAVATLRKAVKEHSIPTENVGLAIETGLAAFRTIRIPFADDAKIEQVLKFEVESLLPQWDIEDVVVDFHKLEATGDASELLVTAVRKVDLGRVLRLCTAAGIEPLEAELESTALVNAALASDLCRIDNAQILVHVGETSTSVVVMDSGKVREMRAIHLGAASHELAASSPAGEGEAAPGEPAATEPDAPEEESAPADDPAERERRLDQVVRRIRRELGRTVSAARTVHPIEGIHVCGLPVPGLVGSQVLDVPIRALEISGPEGGLPTGVAGELVVAYGAALRQLGGGVLRPALRREELRYTGALERLELPLAVVALLLVTLLGVWNIFLFKESTFLDAKLGVWRDWTKVYLIGDIKRGQPGVLRSPSDDVRRYLTNIDSDTDRTKYEQLELVRSMLQGEVKKLEKDLGQDAEITQPQSALTAATLVLDVLEKHGSEIARPSLRKVSALYQRARANRREMVKVSFDIVFFADSPELATNYYESFLRDLRAQPWYIDHEDRPNNALEDGKGISIVGFAVNVDVSKAPNQEPAE